MKFCVDYQIDGKGFRVIRSASDGWKLAETLKVTNPQWENVRIRELPLADDPGPKGVEGTIGKI